MTKRPPEPYRLSEQDWQSLKARCDLPDTTVHGEDCRALMEWEFHHARDSISTARRAVSARKLRNQLGRIARSRPGTRMPRPILRDVIGMLAGRALGVQRYFKNIDPWIEQIGSAPTVTPEIRQWARECIWLGAGRRTWRRKHGGGDNVAEQDFICVLLYFWRERLGRRVTNWTGIRLGSWEESAAALTTFVAECLKLAGARGPKGKPITIENTRERIRRVAAKLPWALA